LFSLPHAVTRAGGYGYTGVRVLHCTLLPLLIHFAFPVATVAVAHTLPCPTTRYTRVTYCTRVVGHCPFRYSFTHLNIAGIASNWAALLLRYLRFVYPAAPPITGIPCVPFSLLPVYILRLLALHYHLLPYTPLHTFYHTPAGCVYPAWLRICGSLVCILDTARICYTHAFGYPFVAAAFAHHPSLTVTFYFTPLYPSPLPFLGSPIPPHLGPFTACLA